MTTDKRILITGAAGYIGHQLGNRLAKDFFVIGTDIRPRQDLDFPLEIVDVRDPDLSRHLSDNRITHVVHLASILQASSDRQRDHDIDVNGTRNVLEACIAAGVRHITVTSSGAAYGYHPDNPEWIDENDPLRGNPEFAYSDHKRLVEEMLATYRTEHPELQQLIFRPGTVLGAETRNQITGLFLAPRLLAIRGSDSPFVFIWDQDVLAAMEQGIRDDRAGRFNMAGDGALTIGDIAKKLNKPLVTLPATVVRAGLQVAKWLGKPVGPEQVNFLRYRPVLSNRRLKEEFGYRLQKTSEETFDHFIAHARQKGDL
ncbi:NAD-dependent epimerase/dehydratase [Marinobacter santoriniensis NKSG1]|uniref:NAD-dependent epimerase/dehydratase n=1 Tax=Marinobacter santoriniensis NKSG1 TaxID=1288826 RepID=M7CLW6_9GAMM|nr:SDR family oxidoreductase [Marinobacter santoriniensis]EMP54631.1 NAD-dependent epimerase/dehydratase [Marinobacter santoriniensis NKSG1]